MRLGVYLFFSSYLTYLTYGRDVKTRRGQFSKLNLSLGGRRVVGAAMGGDDTPPSSSWAQTLVPSCFGFDLRGQVA